MISQYGLTTLKVYIYRIRQNGGDRIGLQTLYEKEREEDLLSEGNRKPKVEPLVEETLRRPDLLNHEETQEDRGSV